MNYRANLHRRAVGRAIKRWRVARGLSGQELSDAAGWSTAKTSMLQASATPISEADLLTIAMVLNVDPEERDLAYRSVQRSRDIEPCDRGPGLNWRQAELEAEAVELRILANDTVPSPLRTQPYDKAVRTAQVDGCHVGYSAAERERALNQLQAAAPLRVHLVLSEAAVRRTVGDENTVADQLLSLVLLSGLPNLSVQILPDAVGAYAGMGMSFTSMSFVERQFDDVVCVPGLGAPTWIEATGERLVYEQSFAAAAKAALPAAESMEWIVKLSS